MNTPELTIKQPSEVVYIDVEEIPAWILFLHKQARNGRAARYGNTTSLCAAMFTVDEVMSKKWANLADVERVTVMYRRN